MQLSLFRTGLGTVKSEVAHESGPWEDEFNIALSPASPVLEITVADLLERHSTEVLLVKVTDDRGRISHLHFSLSVLDNGRIRGDVTAITGPDKSVSKTAVANWRNPVNPEPLKDD